LKGEEFLHGYRTFIEDRASQIANQNHNFFVLIDYTEVKEMVFDKVKEW